MVDAHEVPGDLEVVADDRPVLLPAPGDVVAPVLVEPLLDERAVVVVREALLDRVGDRNQHVEVLVVAGRQPGVDQVRRDVVADRVPVLARPVAAQRVALAVERDRVEVRPVAAVLGVVEEPLEERDRRVDVGVDPLVAGDPEDLGRPDEGVDLLVGRDGLVVVAELRGEDLLLVRLVDLDGVIPVGHALARVVVPEVLAEVLDAGLGRHEEAILAGHVVGRRQAVDETRDRVGLLPVAHLVAGHVDPDAVLAPVRLAVAELRLHVEVGHLPDLLDPPVRLLPHVVVGVGAREGQLLRLVDVRSGLRVEHPVGEHVPAGDEHVAHLGRGIDVRLAEIAHEERDGRVGQPDRELATVARLDDELVGVAVVVLDVAGDRVGEREGHHVLWLRLRLRRRRPGFHRH